MLQQFIPPTLPDKTVKRQQLAEVFQNKWFGKFLYITAPAGYGKTVSTIQWLNTMKIKTAWLSLNIYDNLPASFFRLFGTAVLSAHDSRAAKLISENRDFMSSPVEHLHTALLKLSGAGAERVLVLDDFHVIENNEILRALPLILKKLPKNQKVVFISRTGPPPAFSGFILDERMQLIESGCFPFSNDEIKNLYEKRGIKITAGEADRLLYYTSGWPICVSAALLAGNAVMDRQFDNTILDSYIKNEVWDLWSGEKKDFLMKTSVAESLNLELCARLTGIPDTRNILQGLVSEGAFLIRSNNGEYCLHHLFRDFLTARLNENGNIDKNELYIAAAKWHFERGNYFESADFCLRAGDYESFNKTALQINKYSSDYNCVEDELNYISTRILGALPEHIIEQSPVLLEMCAYASYLSGDAGMFTSYLDKMCVLLPEIVQEFPEFSETVTFMMGLDHRLSLTELSMGLIETGISETSDDNVNSNTITQNLPYFHRSQRDYSEFANNFETLQLLEQSFGRLIGRQYAVIEDCIRAGLLLEQDKTAEAFEYAVSANSKLEHGFSGEIIFCAKMILATVLYDTKNSEKAEKIEREIDSLIEGEAMYLMQNFRAFTYRRRLALKDTTAAEEWLSYYSENTPRQLSFYKIYQHFTTARAYLVKGDYDEAVLFISKLVKLSEGYGRPLDIIESNVLYSIAWWKKGKREKAVSIMEEAVGLAAKYGYVRIFTELDAASIILHKCHKRLSLGKEPDAEKARFAKLLYYAAYERNKNKIGAADAPVSSVKLSKRQVQVVRLLSRGLSYKDISAETGLAVTSVKTHIKGAYSKLEVTNSSDAAAKARELGLL